MQIVETQVACYSDFKGSNSLLQNTVRVGRGGLKTNKLNSALTDNILCQTNQLLSLKQ